MVALKPAKPSNENPDPNADMILPEDEENGGEEEEEEEEDSTAIPGGILVATVRFFFSVIRVTFSVFDCHRRSPRQMHLC